MSYNLALACFEATHYDRAAEILQALTGPQATAEAFDLLGAVEERRAHTDAAEHDFQEATRRDAAGEDYRFDYGNSLVQHGKLETGAARIPYRGFRDLPKSWRLRIGLGSMTQYLAGDYQGAAEASTGGGWAQTGFRYRLLSAGRSLRFRAAPRGGH